MLCTIIKQIAVEINSNYGLGFKSIIFLFVLKYPKVQLWSLALFTFIVSLQGSRGRDGAHAFVSSTSAPRAALSVFVWIFSNAIWFLSVHQYKVQNSHQKEQGLMLFLFNISYKDCLCVSAVSQYIPHTLQSSALTWGLAHPFISITCWICSAYIALHLIVWWFRNKYELEGIDNSVMPNIPEFLLIRYLHWTNKCGRE